MKNLRNGFLLLFFISGALYAETVSISQFDQKGLSGWEQKKFVGETQYKLIDEGGKKVLKAESKASASGLYRKIRIDLEKTPWLNWSWKIEKKLSGLNERQKSGDDYSARVYVVIDGGLFFWNTRALNYVWSSHQPEESRWPNAYTDHARMIAVQSGDEKTGKWVFEKRNIRDEFLRQFGESPRYIDAVAVMTDADNTKGWAVAYYRKLFFSSE